MDVIQFICCLRQFLFQLFDDLVFGVNFLLDTVVSLLLLEQLLLSLLLLLHQPPLVFSFLLQLELQPPLFLSLKLLLFLKGITTLHKSLLHLLQDHLEIMSLLGFFLKLIVCFLNNLLLLLLLFHQLLRGDGILFSHLKHSPFLLFHS